MRERYTVVALLLIRTSLVCTGSKQLKVFCDSFHNAESFLLGMNRVFFLGEWIHDGSPTIAECSLPISKYFPQYYVFKNTNRNQ